MRQTNHFDPDVARSSNVNCGAVQLDNTNLEIARQDVLKIDISIHDASPGVGLSRQPQAFALCLSKSLRWETGAVIPVAILNTHNHNKISSRRINEIVKGAAWNWEVHANISFTFIENQESAVVRIKYAANLNSDPSSVSGWSFLGRNAESQPKGEPTMELSIGRDADEDDIRSLALHEFGHALGMPHEHSSPICPIDWDVPAVIARCGDTDSTRHNFLQRESPDDTEFSPFDPKSIMIYNIPFDLMKNPIQTARGKTLSAMDKKWARIYYPFKKESSRPKSYHPQSHSSDLRCEDRQWSLGTVIKEPDYDILEKGMKIFRCERENCRERRQCDGCFARLVAQFQNEDLKVDRDTESSRMGVLNSLFL